MFKLGTIILFLMSRVALCDGLSRETYEGVRATGMGNAFTSIVDDGNMLWYNPAALTSVSGVRGNLFDLTLGADQWGTLTNLYNGLSTGDFNSLISGDKTYLRFSAKPAFYTKYFGLSLFSITNGYWNIQRLLFPTVDVYAYSDLGVIAGIGLPVGDYISLGFSVRAFMRTGMDFHMDTASMLASLGISQIDFMRAIYDELAKASGTGYAVGLNVGSLLKIPIPGKHATRVQAAITVENFGQTTFLPLRTLKTPTNIPMSVNLGSALIYDLDKSSKFQLAADYRNALGRLPFFKKAHLGIEYQHRYFGLRAGFSEGYPSYGMSLTVLPHTQFHFSSYSYELGNNYHEQSQRFYLLQAVIGFNPL